MRSLVALSLLCLLAAPACQRSSTRAADSDPGASPSEAARPAPTMTTPTSPAVPDAVPHATITLTPRDGVAIRVTAEVVRTPRRIRRGLMHRRHLPADQGMLFLMGEETVHSFWMRNTLIPLDMIFIGRDLRVVGVVENARPLTDDSRRVDAPSLYVLEVNGGFCAANHIGAGTVVAFEGVAP